MAELYPNQLNSWRIRQSTRQGKNSPLRNQLAIAASTLLFYDFFRTKELEERADEYSTLEVCRRARVMVGR
jgi:hypothetical protein